MAAGNKTSTQSWLQPVADVVAPVKRGAGLVREPDGSGQPPRPAVRSFARRSRLDERRDLLLNGLALIAILLRAHLLHQPRVEDVVGRAQHKVTSRENRRAIAWRIPETLPLDGATCPDNDRQDMRQQ